MKIRKSTGPGTEPCGTPDVTCWKEEVAVLSTMHCLLFARYDVIHSIVRLSNLWDLSFISKISWSTTSNAFLRSKKTAPVSSPFSIFFSHLSSKPSNAVLHSNDFF